MEVKNTSSTYYSENYTPPKKQLGQDEFFKILSAQLQHQDPLSGGDNTEFVAQMAQFSALEQMQNLNSSFKEMMSKQDLILGSDLIGKQVAVYEGDELLQGVVEGFMITKEGLLFSVDGKTYSFSQIVAIKDKPQPVEEPQLQETEEEVQTEATSENQETTETTTNSEEESIESTTSGEVANEE